VWAAGDEGIFFANPVSSTFAMTKIESLEHEVQNLSPAELSSFREWFLAFDAEAWDRQLERDVAAGRLDDLAEQALAAHRRGESREI